MTLFQAFGQFAGSGVAPAPVGTAGWVLIKPSSISNSGGTATLGANGQVTFSSINSVSMENVFSAAYLNYVIVTQSTGSTDYNLGLRLRVSGSDASTNYTRQYLYVDSTTVDSARTSSSLAIVGGGALNVRSGGIAYIYSPFVAAATDFRTTHLGGSSLFLLEETHNHSDATSYTGCTLLPNTGNTSGTVTIYGVRS